AERLEWEREWDGLKKMREWLIANSLASGDELDTIEHDAKESVRDGRQNAWESYLQPIRNQIAKAVELINDVASKHPSAGNELKGLSNELSGIREPLRRDVMRIINLAIDAAGESDTAYWLKDYYNDLLKENESLFNSHLYNEGPKSALKIEE